MTSSSTDPYEEIERMLQAAFGPQIASEVVAGMRASGIDPAQLAASGMMPDLTSLSPAQLMAMHAQVSQLMAQAAASAASGDSVNWQMGQDLAVRTARSGGDPTVTAAQAEQVRGALQVADLWLDAVTDLLPAPGPRQAWSRRDWVERTMPTWKTVCAPVTTAVVDALTQAMTHQLGSLGPGVFADGGDGAARAEVGAAGSAGGLGEPGAAGGMGLTGVMRALAGTAFGLQLGQAVGHLAAEAVSATGVGLPLDAEPGSALVPAGVASFADGLDVSADEVRMFLAVREAAAARLYARVPWLRSQVLGAVEAYAREIRIDMDAVEAAVAQVDPRDPDALRRAMESGVFQPQRTDAQNQALERLETLLALVEGWVETVTTQAAAAHLPGIVALSEMWRRRRLAGAGAEQVFARLIGLEFRPRRVREAARLWQRLGQEAGASERDALWQHPDVMPTAAELAHPDDFLTLRQAAADMDAAIDADLAQILDGTLGYADGVRRADADARPDAAAPGTGPGSGYDVGEAEDSGDDGDGEDVGQGA